MAGLIGLAVLVLDIIAIVDCIKSAKAGTQKLLWILVIVVLPLIGMILYFVMGKKKPSAS